ncbi:MAG: IPT/TIG domain-containing protein [Planctomycetes bacterium]|nr:IPT/TIG domain-containing protein [Planctomycetota bacterium]
MSMREKLYVILFGIILLTAVSCGGSRSDGGSSGGVGASGSTTTSSTPSGPTYNLIWSGSIVDTTPGGASLVQDGKLLRGYKQASSLTGRPLTDLSGNPLPDAGPADGNFVIVFLSASDETELGRIGSTSGEFSGNFDVPVSRAEGSIIVSVRGPSGLAADEIAQITLPPARSEESMQREVEMYIDIPDETQASGLRRNGVQVSEIHALDLWHPIILSINSPVNENDDDSGFGFSPILTFDNTFGDTDSSATFLGGVTLFDNDGDGRYGGQDDDQTDIDENAFKDVVLGDLVGDFSLAVYPAEITRPGMPIAVEMIVSPKGGTPPIGVNINLISSTPLFGEEATTTVTASSPNALMDDQGRLGLIVVYTAPTDEVDSVTIRAQIALTEGYLTREVVVPVTLPKLPKISSVATISGGLRAAVGTEVVVRGENFGTDSEAIKVTVGGAVAEISDLEDAQLTLVIPEDAVTGPVLIDVAGQSAATASALTIVPDIEATTPEANAVEVNRFAPIAIRLKSASDAVTTADISLVQDGNAIAGEFQFSEDGSTIVFTPDEALAELTIYSLRLPLWNRAVAFLTGTDPDVTPPTIVSYTPENGSEIQYDDVRVEILFSERLSQAAITSNVVSISGPGGTILGTTTYTEVPDEANPTDANLARGKLIFRALETTTSDGFTYQGLLPGGNYTLFLSSDIRDTSDNTLSDGNGYSFTASGGISLISPAIGLPETIVHAFGGPYPDSASEISVTTGGIPAEVLELDGNLLLFKVAATATTGDVVITTPTDTLTGATFTVTDKFSLSGTVNVTGQPYEITINRKTDSGYAILQDESKLARVPLTGAFAIDKSVVVPGMPTDVVVDESTNRVFVCDFGPEKEAGSKIFILDGTTLEVTGTLTAGRRPVRMAYSESLQRLYVSNFADDTVSVFDTEDMVPLKSIPTGFGPNGIAISQDGSIGVICNYFDDTVTIFDPDGMQSRQKILVGDGPVRASISPDGTEAAITHFKDGKVKLYRLPSGRLLGEFDAGAGALSIEYHPDGNLLAVTMQESGLLRFFKRNENGIGFTAFGQPLPLGDGMTGLSFTPDSSRVFVGAKDDFTLMQIFLEKPAPALTGLSRSAIDPGSVLTITGKNFALNPADNVVKLGTTVLSIDTSSSNRNTLVVTIPEGAANGLVSVERDGVPSGGLPLTITPVTPTLDYVVPRSGSASVPIRPIFEIRFNESMSFSSINLGGFSLEKVSLSEDEESTFRTAVDFQITRVGANRQRVWISPLSDLDYGTNYIFTIGTSLVDLDNHAFDGNLAIEGAQSTEVFLTTENAPPPPANVQAPTFANPPKPGDDFVLTGTGFDSNTKVYINGKLANVILEGDNSLRVFIPTDITTGNANLLIFMSGGVVEFRNSFTIVPRFGLEIISAFPSTIPLSIGGELSIFGVGYVSGTVVKIGGTAVSSVTIVSENQMIVAVPTGTTAGPLSITVEANGLTKSDNTLVRYVAPPAISSVSPTQAPSGGGVVVTLTGSGFLQGCEFIVGQNAVDTGDFIPVAILPRFGTRTETSVAGTLPSLPIGVYSIRVRNTDTQQATKTATLVVVQGEAGKPLSLFTFTASGVERQTSTNFINLSVVGVPNVTGSSSRYGQRSVIADHNLGSTTSTAVGATITGQ